MIIEQIVKWRTSDGKEHHTKEMADQHVLNSEMIEIIGELSRYDDSQDFLNLISGHRIKFREFLDACDAMERASLR